MKFKKIESQVDPRNSTQFHTVGGNHKDSTIQKYVHCSQTVVLLQPHIMYVRMYDNSVDREEM